MSDNPRDDGALLVEIPPANWRVWMPFLSFGLVLAIPYPFTGLAYWSAAGGVLFSWAIIGGAAMFDYSKRGWWVTQDELVAGIPGFSWLYMCRVSLTNIQSVDTVIEGATRLNRRLRPRGGGSCIKPGLRNHVVVRLREPGKYGDLMILSTPRAEEFSDELIAAIKAADRNASQHDGGTS